MSEIKRNKKFNDIYAAAKKLFWQYGIKKVTVEDICNEAKVSRMTFYKYFSNKIELVLVILGDLFDDATKKYDELFSNNDSFSEKLKKMLDLKIQLSNEFSMQVVQELYNSDIEEIKTFFEESMTASLAKTREFIELGKKEGAIKKDLPTEFIIYQIDMIYKQMQDESLYKMFKDTTELTQSILDIFFYGIINDKDK